MIKALCKILVISSMILVSCGEEKKKPAPSADTTPTPEPTDTSDATSKEIERLKAKITELSSSSEPDDNDGWLVVDDPQITKELLLRVDFANDDFNKQMKLTLNECGDIKLLGFGSSDAISNTVNARVGNLIRVGFYRANGEITAPSGACKLTATIIKVSDGKAGKTKFEKISIKAGNTKLSKAKNSDGTTRPFFATNDEGRVTVSVATKGITADEILIMVFKKIDSDGYRVVGFALGDNTRPDGRIIAEVCKVFVFRERENNELICRSEGTLEWMTQRPTRGNYLLMATDKKDITAIIETGEIQ